MKRPPCPIRTILLKFRRVKNILEINFFFISKRIESKLNRTSGIQYSKSYIILILESEMCVHCAVMMYLS